MWLNIRKRLKKIDRIEVKKKWAKNGQGNRKIEK